MTDDIHHPNDTENQPDDHQQAIEACQHALDALSNGDLSHARPSLDKARAAVGCAEHDAPVSQDHIPMQEQRETAFDCYD